MKSRFWQLKMENKLHIENQFLKKESGELKKTLDRKIQKNKYFFTTF